MQSDSSNKTRHWALVAVVVCVSVCLLTVVYVRTTIRNRPVQEVTVQESQIAELVGTNNATCVAQAQQSDVPESEVIFAESLIPESVESSFAQGLFASNLVDGDLKTFAYPGSAELDYLIRFIDGAHPLDGMTIVWGGYGESDYIETWVMEGCTSEGEWRVLDYGEDPKAQEVSIFLDGTAYSALRLRSRATEWIGVYEVQLR